jgi:hypothetical protein
MQIKGIALARARAGRWPALRYKKSRVRLCNSFAVSYQVCGSTEHPPAFHGSASPEELSAGELLEEFEPTFWAAGRFFDHAHPRGFNWMQTQSINP